MSSSRSVADAAHVRFHIDDPAAGDEPAPAASSLAVPKSIRGRSYSSVDERSITDAQGAKTFTAAQVFAPGVLESPLLSDRASGATAKQLFGQPPPRLSMEWNHIVQSVPMPTPGNPNARKRILSNVSGRAYCGETLAIMGPSGSGKTSLLTLLSGGWRKQQQAGNLQGDILINGRPATKMMKRFLAFVAQDDLLFANLTVEQTLRYSALLNLPKELTREQKLDRVEKVIELLGLSKCRKTPIGGMFSRGVSGGERKRTSVANEMLSNPSLILADEPTSGLDSTTAARLISTFRSLARGGRTVICSIHQPSSQIFDLFDKVLLLAQGRTIFYGSASAAVTYFNSTGLRCKQFYNPADFMLEIVSDLTMEGILKEEETERATNKEGTMPNEVAHVRDRSRKLISYVSSGNAAEKGANGHASIDGLNDSVKTLLANDMPAKSYEDSSDANLDRAILRLPIYWARIETDVLELEATARGKQAVPEITNGASSNGDAVAVQLPEESLLEPEDHASRWPLTWWEQFVLLLSRSYLQHKGERVTKIYTIQVLAPAIIVGLVWFQTGRNVSDLQALVGVLFFIGIFWCFSPLFNALTTFPAERAVIIKERAGGTYRLSAYYMAKVVAEVPVELAFPIVFMCICYFMVGLRTTAEGFFCTVLTILLSCLTAQSYGLLISCTLLDFKESITFASVSMLSLMLLSGFYVTLDDIPIWLRWASWLVFPRYAYNILAYIQFHGDDFDCGDNVPQGMTFPTCTGRPGDTASGSDIMAAFSFDELPVWANVLILIAMTIVFRVWAYLALRQTTKP